VNHLFPPLLPKEGLAPPVLVIVAHPDDEVIGCGGMLAWHRRAGHAVTVVHLTDGAAGDPENRYPDFAEQRRREGEAALRQLGVEDVRGCGYPDGHLPEHAVDASRRVREIAAEIMPKTLYGFFFSEAHRDHRAAARALAAAGDVLPADCRCLLFGVNQPVLGATLFDVTEFAEHKRRALASYESQLGYNDFAEKILQRDHGATLNIEDPAVQRVETFAVLRPDQLMAVRDSAESLYRYLLGDEESEGELRS